MAGNVQAFPSGIAIAVQQNFLERKCEEGLDSIMAFRKLATMEEVPAGIGETVTKTRKGRLAPITAPSVPQTAMSLDNGLAPLAYSLEQYTLTMRDWNAATGDIDSVQNQVGVFDQVVAIARNSGVHAAQSRERIARNNLFGSYMSGNTRVRVDQGNSSTTTCHVDDVTGLLTSIVNGVVTPVSATNPVLATEYGPGGALVQALSITSVAVDGTNVSTNVGLGGASGVITFATAVAPVHGDAIVTKQAPIILRPNGRNTFGGPAGQGLVGGDLITLQTLLDAKTALENNGVPPFANGMYAVVCDPTTERELFADQDFKVYHAGREQSPTFKRGYILQVVGLEIIVTTEAPQQAAFTLTANSVTDQCPFAIHRPVVIGADAIIEGTFQGLQNYVRNLQGSSEVVAAYLIDNTVHLLRKPVDRLARWYSFAWDWIGGYAIPTDVTATPTIIPTASNAAFKRAVIIEHV